ncbi:MAG: hypothetical protein CVT70_16875 [Alphaproteobacteria bacterium HGW-Alphaproteobacteria-1]|jgi:hypothetical protein|nr:MAG: hypothetical protein CVT70_16875 [Alphaproteobacteria bacterium HGW-Alphaproteobacteria-1]
MICARFQGIGFAGQQLDCLGSAAEVWAWGLVALIIAASFVLGWRARRKPALRLLTAALFSLAAMALALVIEQPVLRQSAAEGEGGTIVVLLDASESFWRDGDAASAALSRGGQRVAQFQAQIPAQDAAQWQGALRLFGQNSRAIGGETSLANLSVTLRNYRVAAPEPTSDLRAGLMATLATLRSKTGQRMVMLISDGWTSAALDDALLDDFRTEGIPIHIVTAGAAAPAAGLIAADIGPEHRLGEWVILRGTVLGAGEAVLDQGESQIVTQITDSRHLRAIRLSTRLSNRGLQGVRLGFTSDLGQQGKSLFTLVRGPARLLVFGAAPWADALPTARWQPERGDPAAPPDPAAYDLVVIDALAPSAFPADYIETLLAAADGTGLFWINGGLRGAVDQPQIISDWNETVLNPILPVDSDPRIFVQEPPPRDIVIMVDVSGSMGGTRLGSAQSAINAILSQLRPRDTVAILPFADGALRPFAQAAASPATLDAARRYTAGLSAGGGTAPADTIRDSAKFVSNYCAFFFISDADFEPPQAAPQCFTTAISVSDSHFPMDISKWGEEILLGESGNAGAISMRYFKPDERTEFFRQPRFRPVMTGAEPGLDGNTDVEGIATSYPRADAKVESVHADPPPDPVFVWRRDSSRTGIVTGAFLGPMGAEWGGQSLAATEAMLNLLLGWPDQDKYLIRLSDIGGSYRLAVTEIKQATTPGTLSASMLWPDGSATGISLHFDPRLGANMGDVIVSRSETTRRAMLVLQQGADIQRIPVTFPRPGPDSISGSERLDHGINLNLISHIIESSNGLALDQQEIRFYDPPMVVKNSPLYPFLLAFAFAMLALAVWSRELKIR